MRNFILTEDDDQKYEVTNMYDVHGLDTYIADEAEAIIIKFSEDQWQSTPVRGKVWTLQ